MLLPVSASAAVKASASTNQHHFSTARTNPISSDRATASTLLTTTLTSSSSHPSLSKKKKKRQSLRNSQIWERSTARSLARAGKVKAATPKVDKQDKKKSPKGRAKKRLVYTRRFVNVTLTGGKRKERRLIYVNGYTLIMFSFFQTR
ncbi:Ribosomal S30/ubiquitin fusion [Rasamsonia emersonii CBS 393.64]|uniref:Ribosomal S30/ubiquitin fusion n=1 Tax=Rasamsonia emersonii (strain ATCC 16479 / CBS 393.64 / IMI 116815) TaxID=1408163 RepID=A0A0F4Z2X2_RASE3|nr:Ribosomal S30/ubiquitin fusion [Rasamsonia emersonii CBS 393.64]KKA24874.1 Ribosomal S30/ubiquitin fusion [Rasamsonia emersonii CBS 393.64]